jgi:hypothetical protein
LQAAYEFRNEIHESSENGSISDIDLDVSALSTEPPEDPSDLPEEGNVSGDSYPNLSIAANEIDLNDSALSTVTHGSQSNGQFGNDDMDDTATTVDEEGQSMRLDESGSGDEDEIVFIPLSRKGFPMPVATNEFFLTKQENDPISGGIAFTENSVSEHLSVFSPFFSI